MKYFIIVLVLLLLLQWTLMINSFFSYLLAGIHTFSNWVVGLVGLLKDMIVSLNPFDLLHAIYSASNGVILTLKQTIFRCWSPIEGILTPLLSSFSEWNLSMLPSTEDLLNRARQLYNA